MSLNTQRRRETECAGFGWIVICPRVSKLYRMAVSSRGIFITKRDHVIYQLRRRLLDASVSTYRDKVGLGFEKTLPVWLRTAGINVARSLLIYYTKEMIYSSRKRPTFAAINWREREKDALNDSLPSSSELWEIHSHFQRRKTHRSPFYMKIPAASWYQEQQLRRHTHTEAVSRVEPICLGCRSISTSY